MSNPLTETKTQLRQRYRKLRASLGEETRTRFSQSICEWLAQWPLFQQSDCILSYMPIQFEADLTSLLTRFPEKRWVLPRIIPQENHRMVFHPYDATRLVRHPFGMAEPAADLPLVPPSEIQLVLVPGLAFDRRGWRLGYGGGYFDRFLSSFAGFRAGIVFHALLLDELPHDPFDIPVQWVVTERGIFRAFA